MKVADQHISSGEFDAEKRGILHDHEKCAKIVALYRKGENLRAIAIINSISHETVRKVLIDYGVLHHNRKLNSKEALKYGGYVKVFVGKDYPGANKQGYIGEHRLVMQESIGRRLNSWEVVHHIDRNKSNNALSNLKLVNRCDHPTCLNCPYYEFYLNSERKKLDKI